MDIQTLVADLDWRLLLVGAGGLLLGILLTAIWAVRKTGLLKTKIAVAESTIRTQQAVEAERKETIDRAQSELSHTFRELARESLKDSSQSFLTLAEEHLGKHQEKAAGDLKQRQKAIETLIDPIREALKESATQIAEVEKDRKQAYGSIKEQLKSMGEAQASLQNETRSLVNALRRPEVRGQWGEITLQRLTELAGMVEYCDFYQQENVDTDEGRMRPDMIIRLPNGRELIVDVKTPLDAYLSAMEADNEISEEAHLKRHADNVRKRVRELSLKAYWAQFENSPEFVILFIPGDQFLSAALKRHPDLLEDALHQKVILATPTSLVALLKAVAYGWRQVALEENAKQVQAIGEELYKRLSTFSGHISKLGRQLGSSVDSYNQAVGSLERNVLPGARKFSELGVAARKEIDELTPLEKAPREVNVLTADAEPDQDEAGGEQPPH
jgi:DNA recombination protein RmuC